MSSKLSNTDKGEGYALEGRIRIAFGNKSLSEIAKLLGVSYPGLNHFLRGHRRLTVEVVRKISDLTGYSIHWLVTGEGPQMIIARTEEEIVRDYLLGQVLDLSEKQKHQGKRAKRD